MAETALVDANIDFGRDLVRALDEEPDAAELKPTAAFWYFFPDDEVWRLVLVLPAMQDQAPQEVYRRLVDVVNRRVQSPSMPVDAIGLAPPDFRLAQLLKNAITTPSDAVSGIRFTNNVINGELVEDAYIYRVT